MRPRGLTFDSAEEAALTLARRFPAFAAAALQNLHDQEQRPAFPMLDGASELPDVLVYLEDRSAIRLVRAKS